MYGRERLFNLSTGILPYFSSYDLFQRIFRILVMQLHGVALQNTCTNLPDDMA